MATEAQINANRDNAQLSTGPRSIEGKAASSQNALRHGLASRGIVIVPGQEEDFQKLESDLRVTLKPEGPLQELIFRRALTASWTLFRCGLAEVHLYGDLAGKPDLDPILDIVNQDHYTRIRKYARESESSFYRAIRELAKLQEEARFRQQTQSVEEEAESEICKTATVSKAVYRFHRNEAKSEGAGPVLVPQKAA
jgi:hypothetical protein